MRYLAFMTGMLCLAGSLFAQNVYTIKADSIKLTNCDSTELILENHSQGVKGFLYNTGNGRTQFKKGLQKINDSIYIIGADTLKYNAWVQGGNSFGKTGILGTRDNNHLDFYTNDRQRGRWTSTGNFLIDTIFDNGSKLQVNGESYFNGPQQITGTITGGSNISHTTFNPTINPPATAGAYSFGELFEPVFNLHANNQQLYGIAIEPTYNINGFSQHTDAISPALYVKSALGGIWIEQSSSYPGNTGQPLVLNQSGSSDKEMVYIYRNGNLTNHPFIWIDDNRPIASKGNIVPVIRSTISNPTAGGGVSFTLDRLYYGSEASIDMHYETTPDTTANENTSIAFNTTSLNSPVTPMYINGSKVGIGTKNPTTQLHTTGSIRFAGLTNDSTQARVLVSDADGNLYYRSAASLAANDIIHSSLAVNGVITAKKLQLSATDWPDYVFDDSYHIMPLHELERYLQRNRHLPGLLPAPETEHSGVDIGKTQTVLLKKIEELTLYTIEQDKKIKVQFDLNMRQEREVEELKKELEELRKLIVNKADK